MPVTRCLAWAGLLGLAVVATAAEPANIVAADRTLIVLAAPAIGDEYYHPRRREILAVQVALAHAILGRDNVVVLGDRATCRELAGRLPNDVLLEAPMRDIWMRDFSPVGMDEPVLFRYSAAAQGGRQADADWVQAGFLRFARKWQLDFRRAPWILDGGNVVDNGASRAIVTDRFLADNHLGKAAAAEILCQELGVTQLAILPAAPDDRLGHADGLAAFIATNTIALTRHAGAYRKALRRELKQAFAGVKIVEIDSPVDTTAFDPAFGSAKGLYVNAIVTDRFIYLPVFGLTTDVAALARIRAATDREVVPVDAGAVAELGGSVRCLVAQCRGANARRLIEAARGERRPGKGAGTENGSEKGKKGSEKEKRKGKGVSPMI